MKSTIVLRAQQLRAYRALRGWNTDAALASAMKVHHTTVSRVLRGKTGPGEEFIANLLAAFPELTFGDLFEVVEKPEDDPLPRGAVA